MADIIRILEIVCAIIAIIFALYGVQLLGHLDSKRNVRDNLAVTTNALFLLIFNSAAAYQAIFASGSFVGTYFGYLVTWTGRGLHFLLMGLYIFPQFCAYYSTKLGKCFERSRDLEKPIIIGSWLSMIFGIVLLVLRCTVVSTNNSYGISMGSSQPMDVLSIAAIVASVGMIIFGVYKGLNLQNHGDTFNLLFWHGMTVAFFVTLAGAASLVSSLMNSPTVGMLFGFLYHCLGRGLFYLCMGFYMFPQNEGGLYYICSIVGMVVGIVYIVLFFLARSRPTPSWAASATYTTQPVSSQTREMGRFG